MNKQEKKLKTVSTSVKEENVEITQVTANGNVVIHPVTKAQNVKYKNSNLNDVLENKIALDGDGGQNFNFIENKVVQDGLVDESWIPRMGDFTIMFDIKEDVLEDNSQFIFSSANANAYYVYRYGKLLRLGGSLFSSGFTNFTEDRANIEEINRVCFIRDGLKNILIFNGDVFIINKEVVDITAYLKTRSVNSYRLTYNRPLAPQEIQHNFSVLNNKPSIKELHTTDAEGKTSILKLASSEDFVEMSTGRTLREEYMGVLKTMGKEFTSADGSPVEVNNGIEARLINGEIKGQTVKNYAPTGYFKFNKRYTSTSNVLICDNVGTEKKTLSFNVKTANSNIPKYFLRYTESGTEKTLDIGGGNHTGKYTIGLGANWSVISLEVNQGGAEDQFQEVFDIMVINTSDINKVNSYIPFGLSSTQAIINNNGQQYPIYATEEDKVNKKVILLGGVGGIQDTLEILDDGSGVLAQKFIDIPIKNLNFTSHAMGSMDSYGDLFRLTPYTDYTQIKNVPKCICDITNATNTFEKEGFALGYKHYIYFMVNRAKAGIDATDTIDTATPKAIKWYNDNISNSGGVLKVELATPIVTHIPKELIPTVLTHNQTNILEAGGAVKPSSFKVTVPVDKLAEIEARLQALESTTVDVVLNK